MHCECSTGGTGEHPRRWNHRPLPGDDELVLPSAGEREHSGDVGPAHGRRSADQVDALAGGRVDVAIVRPPYFDEPIVTVPLFTEPIVLCTKADHRFADATSLPLEELLDEPLVQLVNTPRRWMDFWHFNGIRNEAARTRPDPALTLSELRRTLLCEDVVQPASVSAWRHGMASPRLRAVPIDGAPASEVAIGFRRGEVCADILDFAQCATEVARS